MLITPNRKSSLKDRATSSTKKKGHEKHELDKLFQDCDKIVELSHNPEEAKKMANLIKDMHQHRF
jgi:hypothetical protein